LFFIPILKKRIPQRTWFSRDFLRGVIGRCSPVLPYKTLSIWPIPSHFFISRILPSSISPATSLRVTYESGLTRRISCVPFFLLRWGFRRSVSPPCRPPALLSFPGSPFFFKRGLRAQPLLFSSLFNNLRIVTPATERFPMCRFLI